MGSLNSLNIPLSVETVCVFTAPVFSAFASWATYLLTKVCLLPNMTSLVNSRTSCTNSVYLHCDRKLRAPVQD